MLDLTEPKSMPRSARETANFERPYSPGWFDRLTDWVDRMPGPNSLYCLGLLVFQFGYVMALLWFMAAPGRLDRLDLPSCCRGTLSPLVRFYLTRAAQRWMPFGPCSPSVMLNS